MFSLREYLTNLFTNPAGAVDEIAVQHALRDIGIACKTWGREIRLKHILNEMGV